VPVVLVLATNRTLLALAVIVMVVFHLHILSTFPMGVPLEWNIFMIFSTLFLFGVHGEIGPSQLDAPWAIALLAAAAAIVVLGNVFPERFSFLLSMRYYAGNWATSYWCFREGAVERFDRDIKKVAPAVRTQLATLYTEAEAQLVLDVGQAWRSMHHHGRALNALLPRAVDDLAAYDVQEGETIAGGVLGWNFGEGHLHDEQLLGAVQERCGFADGDLRVVILESQPIHRQSQRYRIVDAAAGLIESGSVPVADMVRSQPWLGYGCVQRGGNPTMRSSLTSRFVLGAAVTLIALGATVTLRSRERARTLPMEDLYVAYMKKAMAEDEIVEAIEVPLPAKASPPALRFRTFKLSKRFDSDISAVCAAFAIELDGDRIRGARVAFGGMAATPKRAPATETALAGAIWNEAAARAAMEALASDYAPLGDMRASADYRRQTAQNLLYRFFLETRPEHPLPASHLSVFATA